MKVIQRLGILIVFLTLAVSAKASYTLTDEDVEVDANGYIISCSYSFVDKDIIIPETLDGYTVKGIGVDYNNLFYDKDIESIQFPSGIEFIGRYAFAANKLASITIPSSLTSIEERAFSSNLFTSITIPNSVTSIGKFSFAYNQLTSVTIPSGAKYIGEGAFRSNKITGITISDGVISIGAWAFYKNELTSVAISNSVSSIGEEAFGLNDLTEFVLPTLTVTGFVDWIDGNGNHYAGGASVTDLSTNYRANFPYVLTDADVEMDANGYIISCSYSFEASMITIPDMLDGYTVKGIGDDFESLFYEKAITSIQLPSGLEYIGYSAFSHNLLTSFTIPANIDSIADHTFSYNLLSEITIPDSVSYIGHSAFQVNKLTNVTIPENVTSIGNNAFRNNQLTSISIPNQVIFIGSSAFNYNQLTELSLPSPTAPGFIDWVDGNGNHYEAGAIATDLSTYYKASIPYILTDDDVEMDANGYIISCSYNFAEKDILIPEILDGIAVKGIGHDYSNLFYNKGITTVQLPSGIEELGNAAFGRNVLTGIDIPATVKVIGNSAFYLNRITNLVIPEGVESIGSTAFRENRNLTSVTLPNSLTFMGERAFQYCRLNSVSIPGSLNRIESWTFGNNPLSSVTMSNGVTYIGPSAFCCNYSLESIELPNSLLTIATEAFRNSHLTGVTIPNSVTHIMKSAFDGNQFTSFLLPTPTLTGFVDWIDGNGNHYAGGEEVTIDLATPTFYRARSTYTLKDEDVEMDANGYIISSSYNFEASMITIPETLDGVTVKGIADGSYNSGIFASKAIDSVQLPSTIEYIGSYAFSYNLMASIDIPNSVIGIGTYAFASNYLFSGFVLPSPTLTGFVDWVETKSGTEYEGGDTVTDLTGNYVARFAYILTDDDVVMDANGYIISSSYAGTEGDIIIPDTLDGIKVIGIADGVSVEVTADVAATSGVFSNKALTSVTLPLTLEYIGTYAFNSNQLRSVTIPNSVVFIGEHAFAINPLTGFELPIPEMPGFLNWVNTKSGIEYVGGDTVTDLTGTYEARFAIFADGFESEL